MPKKSQPEPQDAPPSQVFAAVFLNGVCIQTFFLPLGAELRTFDTTLEGFLEEQMKWEFR